MSELIKISASSTKKIKDLCDLAKEIWQEFYSDKFEEEVLNYIFEFLIPSAIKDEINLDNTSYYFIVNDCENIGFVQTVIEDSSLVLLKFYLKKEYRNKGIGQEIFNEIINEAKENSIKNIVVRVYKENHKTISLFEKWGFIKKDELVRYIGSDYFIEEIEMEMGL